MPALAGPRCPRSPRAHGSLLAPAAPRGCWQRLSRPDHDPSSGAPREYRCPIPAPSPGRAPQAPRAQQETALGAGREGKRLEGHREAKPMEEPRTTVLPHPGVDLRTHSPHTQPTRSHPRTAAGPGKMRGRSSASPPSRSHRGTEQHPEIQQPPRIPPATSHLFFWKIH